MLSPNMFRKRRKDVHVDPKGRFVYFNNPKAGCSTILATLDRELASEAGEDVAWKTIWDVHDRDLLRTELPTVRGPEELAKLMASPDCMVFSYVRDPIARSKSAYLDKIAGPFNVNGRRFRRLAGRRPRAKVSFSDYCSILHGNPDIRNADGHWREQRVQLFADVVSYDSLQGLRTMDETLPTLLEGIFGRKVELVDTRELLGHSTASRTTDVSPEDLEMLEKAYSADYAWLSRLDVGIERRLNN